MTNYTIGYSGSETHYCKRCSIMIPTISQYKFDGYCVNCRVALHDGKFEP